MMGLSVVNFKISVRSSLIAWRKDWVVEALAVNSSSGVCCIMLIVCVILSVNALVIDLRTPAGV